MNGGVFVSTRDLYGTVAREVQFRITADCLMASCTCVHYVGGNQTQFKPCQVFCECFYKGGIDADWKFVLHGSIFGFKVINH